MAITKIHAIKSTLGKALAYIENPDKTDGQMLVSGYNCEPQTASIDFEMTAVLAHKTRNLKRKRFTNLAYHLIQSFSPEDAVTPEQAHELGKKLAFEYTGGKYEYVVATHIDKGHIHNHIMLNAVSFYDYKKLRTVPYRTARQIRDISDRLCMEAHLSVIDNPQTIGQLYPENVGKKKSVSNRTEIRKRLNFCLERATEYSQFLSMAKGLEITPTIRGKHKQLFDGQVYTTPGNHDVRWWNANGKRTFTNQVGPLYQSFTYGGVHFVLLDTTVNFELDGKIGKAQLQWLKSDLDSIPADMPVILFGHHPFKINNNVTARHELLSATKDSNVIAFMNGHVHYYGNVVEDGVPINYITYIKDNPNQDFVTIEFSENYYYIYKRKATDHSKELWLSGRMNNTRKLRMTITNITARDNTVDVAVQIENAPDGVKSVQARIDNYGPYTQLIKNEGGIWSGSIDTGLYTPELVAGTHFVGVEAFDNENKKWTEYKDYSTPSDNPTIKWVFETGDSIQSSATINEANVYVGSNDGNLYCIDLDTGYQKWCIQTGDFVISKPAITSEGNIVFGSGDEFVYCASANDGNVIWNTKLGGSVLSDPLTSEGRVFIGCGDGKIYCLNSASGEIVWEYQTDGLMRQRPILENGILYAFVRDTYIWYAIDASTGQLIWRGNANTDESLFVCGDVRPVIANGKLWCIDAQNTRPAYLSLDTGEPAWTSTLEKVSSRGMTTNGSTVFYSSNSGRQITAFDAETNQVVWQKDLRYDNKDRDLQEMQIDSALVYNGTSLIHVAERGRITALNPDNGEILWCIDAAGYPERVFWSTPEATDGLVIATGIDGKVYAVEYTH